jgi:hypothetical protein
MGRASDLFGQPLPYRPHSPRGATLSVAKKDERVALIFWPRTAASQRRDVITRSGEHSGEGDLLLISWGELRRSDAIVKPLIFVVPRTLGPGSGKSAGAISKNSV